MVVFGSHVAHIATKPAQSALFCWNHVRLKGFRFTTRFPSSRQIVCANGDNLFQTKGNIGQTSFEQ